jgi:hypothetical protein
MFSLSGMILGYVNCGKGAEGFGPISTNTTGLKVGLNICKMESLPKQDMPMRQRLAGQISMQIFNNKESKWE